MPHNDPCLTPPEPTQGWARSIFRARDALIVPMVPMPWKAAATVYDSRDLRLPEASVWVNDAEEQALPPNEMPMSPRYLPGRHLWAGTLAAHFGHILAEGIARLWAIDHCALPFDGIVYVNRKPKSLWTAPSVLPELLGNLGITLPFHAVTEPTRVQELIIPGLGIGIGEIGAGTPEMQDFIRRRLFRPAVSSGHEHLFISRAGLAPSTTKFIGETWLEDNFKAAGYAVFRPEGHSLDEQMAVYAQARFVVAAEGSPLHLLAYAGSKLEKIAILKRRGGFFLENFQRQLSGFTGAEVTILDARIWSWTAHVSARGNMDNFVYPQLDFGALHKALVACGLISESSAWFSPRRAHVRAAIAATSALIGKPLYQTRPETRIRRNLKQRATAKPAEPALGTDEIL